MLRLRTMFSLLCMVIMLPWIPVNAEEPTEPPLLVIDAKQKDGFPKQFRTMQDALKHDADTMPSVQGLEKLHASGSAAFSEKSLRAIKEKETGKNIVVVDLRQEPHGYVNGIAISWYGYKNAVNEGKTADEIDSDEESRLAAIKAIIGQELGLASIHEKSDGMITNFTTIPVTVEQVESEKAMVQSLGMGYQRFPVQDHTRPSDAQVDGYVAFIRNLPENSWIHAHCRGGKGRTTTFLAVYDMMQNAKDVSLEDIIARQYLLGGSDLFKESNEEYKAREAREREALVRNFYRYAKENTDGFKTSWSAWLKQQKE